MWQWVGGWRVKSWVILIILKSLGFFLSTVNLMLKVTVKRIKDIQLVIASNKTFTITQVKLQWIA